MATSETVDWDVCARCAAEDGIGVRLPNSENCWAHADGQDVAAALKRLSEEGSIDARGVPLTSELLERMLATAPHNDQGRPVLTEVRCDQARFEGALRLRGTIFEGPAVFNEATFEGLAEFNDATFQGMAWFIGATFNNHAEFDNASFSGTAFWDTTFNKHAGFYEATFHGMAEFARSTFNNDAWFVGVTFEGPAVFDEAAFGGQAEFSGATFKNRVVFAKATFTVMTLFSSLSFEGPADFRKADFKSQAWFIGTVFKDDAGFAKAIFNDHAGFHEANFQGAAGFQETTFHGYAGFDNATFVGEAAFSRATFKAMAVFRKAAFEGRVGFDGATFKKTAWFDGATFREARQLGPMLTRKWLVLDEAIFKQRVRIEAAAAVCCCNRTQFLAGVQLRVRWAQVVIDDTDLAAPSLIIGVPRFPELDEHRFIRGWARLPPSTDILHGQPRILSMRGADVAGLTVSNADLRACRFADAHNLDRLRIEQSRFALAPSAWWRTPRLTIIAEHQWRFASGGHYSWDDPSHSSPEWPTVEELTPAQIAALYRSLRKGREDSKDEPGAADFYYGEMEMRRQAASRFSVERAVLTLYWLVAGYALRAWRAVAAALLAVVVFSLLLVGVGFHRSAPGQPALTGSAARTAPAAAQPVRLSLPDAMLYSVRTALSLPLDPQPRLTRWGGVLQIGLRITVPVLLGLAILSIRGRVRR